MFQSYQVDGRLIIKGCMQWSAPFTVEKISPLAGIELGLLDQWGWSGSAMVLGKLLVPGRPANLD